MKDKYITHTPLHCKKKIKCQGCYIYEDRPNKEFEKPKLMGHVNDTYTIQIHNYYSLPIAISWLNRAHFRTKQLLMPISAYSARFRSKAFKTIVTINMWEDFEIKRMIEMARFIHEDTDIEISLNTKNLHDSTLYMKIEEAIYGLNNPHNIIINYVPSHKNTKRTIRKILEIYTALSLDIPNHIWNLAPCIMSTINGHKPCEQYQMEEFLPDGEIIRGCPYRIKICQLSLE